MEGRFQGLRSGQTKKRWKEYHSGMLHVEIKYKDTKFLIYTCLGTRLENGPVLKAFWKSGKLQTSKLMPLPGKLVEKRP